MSDGPTEIGKRLKKARESVGLSANALSERMRNPSPGRSWAGFVESGRIRNPELRTLKAAALVLGQLGIEEEWLVLGKGPMRKSKKSTEAA